MTADTGKLHLDKSQLRDDSGSIFGLPLTLRLLRTGRDVERCRRELGSFGDQQGSGLGMRGHWHQLVETGDGFLQAAPFRYVNTVDVTVTPERSGDR